MGSFKAGGNDKGPDRRRGKHHAKRQGFPKLEWLEGRLLLATNPGLGGNPVWQPTSADIADIQHGPMASLGGQLITLYQRAKGGAQLPQLQNEFPTLQIQNGSVLVGLTTWGDISSLGTLVVNMGMKITSASGQYGLINGWMPINQLQSVAQLPQLVSGHPILKPTTMATTPTYQGIAHNEALQSLNADTAQQQYGVTGAGVTVGVLSDSFNALGGYQTDVSTGDLPAGITPLQDFATGEDEGRAMMQNIYDIAPGAGLQFATAFIDDLSFAQNIVNLATTGRSNIIVDDVGYANEPFFQDGIIAQSVNTVTSQGVAYFSSARNASDYGYLSNFRQATGTVGAIGAGTFMNFAPSGAAVLQLPITTTQANTQVVFQFDQPFATQQPVGSTAAVTSQVNFYVLDASGNIVNPTGQGVDDNTATQQPMQQVVIPSAGSYTVVMQLVKGPAPAHVQFIQFGNNSLIVSKQFGAAGGTYYPSTAGHNSAQNTIGVGATPWWAPPPFLSQTPLASEPFSSTGPSITVRNPDGTLKSSPVTVLNPAVTAPDGGNTTFFSAGFVIQTNNPPFPGQPATTTNLSQDLPSFFGTSSAAPNAAAVAALMKQKAPQITPTEIRAGLIASARPMNGKAKGQWDTQAGYGLIDAVQAISAVDVLTVTSTSPAKNTVVTSTPNAIIVNFNKPVLFSTVDSSDIQFTAMPPGVTVSIGAPVAVDDPNYPTQVAFPFSFHYTNPPTTTANGVYTYVVTGPITSKDGKQLEPTGLISFDLEDVTAPRVNTTGTLGRLVTIQFTKPMNPDTITLNNLLVARQGNTGNWNSPINLNSDPRVRLTYNALTNTATLDYSGLPQTAMPSDEYAIVVMSGPGGATDAVGNQLDGNFNGSFPSGDGVVGGNFFQDLGYQVLKAPIVTTFQLTPGTDTGLPSDQNTNLSRPTMIGQVYAAFPGTVANLQLVAEFNALHGGNFDLTVGAGGRGFSGNYDVSTTTDINGKFTFQTPFLPEGFQRARVVAIGQVDSPPLPGYASSADRSFRIDQFAPQVTGASLSDGSPFPANLSTLQSLSLYTQDVSMQAAGYLATPSQVVYPALNPATATNISNYSLYRALGNGQNQDFSQYIVKAVYVALPPTTDASGNYIKSYQGRVDLTLAPGLPAGVYQLGAHTSETWNGKTYPGLFDAAGNALNNLTIPGQQTATYNLVFSIQPTPVYITNMAMTNTANQNNYTTVGGPGSYYDINGQRANAAPGAWMFDVSNSLPYYNSNGQQINYSNYIELVRSADNANSPADGNFGNLGQSGLADSGTGFTKVGGTAVGLFWFDPSTNKWLLSGPSHPNGTRLVMVAPAGGLTATDYYRVYIPNQVTPDGVDRRILDIYGNQLDGEFLGNPTSTVSSQFRPFSSNPSQQFPGIRNLFNYEDMLTTGYASPAPISRMTGDGTAGGAFMTGFVVATTDHILYARPDYEEDPLTPSTAPDGSLAKPYSTLAPEGDPNTAPANPFHDPNGGLNSTQFFLNGFNPNYDRNGNGRFDRSVLYAASQLAYTGPVVAIALPGTPQRDPVTGVVTQTPFVLQAPSGPNSYNDGSASVPFDTTLVFTPGSTLKSLNASLFVQNQGSALQVQGGATSDQQVNFTSYNDASIGGATNDNPNTTPRPGDWGGVVFRSYNESIVSHQVAFPVDGVLQGVNGPAIAGADELMSRMNFLNVRYGGGAVPQSSGVFYNGITLYNSRPSLTNAKITDTGSANGGTQAAVGADMDSFLENDVARGPNIRRVTVTNNSLNGIWLLAQNNGFVEPTNATPMADNPSSLGGSQNYAFFQPLPIIVLAQVIIGQQYNVNSGGTTDFITNRMYVDSGSMFKFNRGSSIALLNPASSINVGSRDYITKFDVNNQYGPDSANFKALKAGDPQVLFTSIFDDAATTTLVPQPINVTGEPTPPPLGPSMWGSIGIQSGGLAVINAATFRYGGGAVNTQQFTLPSQSVLSFINNQSFFNVPFSGNSLGTRVYVTNNNFYNNFDAAMQIEPDGLLAGDPLHPLVSGHPFLRGNVMQGNGIDGLAVLATRSYLLNPNGGYSYTGPREADLSPYGSNQSVNALWDLTDITYVVRGTIVLAGSSNGGGAAPQPSSTTYTAPPAPVTSLTIQAALPGTKLADGTVIASPGAPVVVKFLSENTTHGAGDLSTYGSTGAGAAVNGGAGFIAGVDDAVDPTASPLVDPGAYSQIRILGIPGNQSTGQQRVPVVLTSLRDTTVGTTARGVKNYQILNSYPVGPFTPYAGQSLTAPRPGDGGYIYIGGNSLTTYDLTDPRQGSIIDNADISYMTSIQVQGGGIVDQGGTSQGWLSDKSGYATSFFGPPSSNPLIQLNARMAVRISGSNLNAFSSAAVFAHPTNANALIRAVPGGFPARGTLKGQGVTLYLYNNTISNSAESVRVNSETGDNTTGQSPYVLVSLNNTFYNNPYAIHTVAPQFNGQNSQSHVYTMAMNNIIDGATNTGIFIDGQAALSQLEYNLYFNNAVNVVATTTDGDFPGNINAVYGDPKFVDAANRNFALSPGSAAIDAARSEIGPNPAGDAIYPTVTQPSDGSFYGPRTNPATLIPPLTPGASNLFGGFGQVNDPRKILTLPGSNGFGFQDQWIPVLATAAGATTGSSFVTGAYSFAPIQGQRDELGYIRVDDPTVANTGFGRNPFQDIGAIEYVNLHPPTVTAVAALFAGPAGLVSKNFYTPGGKSGANVTPQYLAVSFSSPISPNSINSDTVELQALGVTGNNPPGQLINLAGKLTYNVANQILYISLGASGLTLPTDAYRLILVGSGSQVLANPQGVALDGENLTNGDDPITGVQLPLPSGNGYPGGNFYNNFIINTVASSVNPGSFALSPGSDTNVVGDLVTSDTTPTFEGTITEPNTALVPLAGQTAVIDIGVVWLDANGNPIGYYDPANTPAVLQQYLRPNAGTALTDANGKFSVTVGQDAANTGLVTDTNPLLSSPYDVGSSGNLIPIPGTTSGYYAARVRIIDQSGNVSNPNAPGAQAAVVVDTGDPTTAGTKLQAAITSPISNAVVSNPGANFSFQVSANKNLDLTRFTPSQIQLVQADASGSFANGTIINIDPASITVKYLDAAVNGGGGGKGRELISFKAANTLANGLYSLTILGTGANGIRDIAGNLLGSDLTTQFAVYNPAAVHGVFVGAGYATDATAAIGTRANPYATIGAAITAAAVGDRIQVLPGVYTESVVMRQLVSLASANPSSTDSTFIPGNALQTIIRAPAASSSIAVSADGLTSFVDAQSGAVLQTEISGFSIASTLVGSPSLGPINPNSVGLLANNSTLLIDKNYFVDSGVGILVTTSASGPSVSSVVNNGIIGNLTGMYIIDQGGTPASATEYVINNTFAFNTTGFGASNSGTTGTRQAYLANNIFWQNHDQTTARNGLAVYSATPNHLVLNNNMFQGNGASDTNTSGVSNNLGNGFNPANLGTTAASALANQGNFVGFPAFITPIDPRPGSDGPATFFLSANYGLSGSSAAINNALESAASRTDFLGNAENPNPTTKGFHNVGYGPRDVGAFEYVPVGANPTIPVGGSFRVVTTSLVPDGGTQAKGATLTVASSPNVVIVNFSNELDPSSVKPGALSLSGAGVNFASPVYATSATMLDSHSVKFTLAGKFNSSGAVNVSVAAGSLKNKYGQTLAGYADKVYLSTAAPAAPTTPAPVVTTPTPVVTTPTVIPTTPAPAPSPVAPGTPPPAASPTTVATGRKRPTRRPMPVKTNAGAAAAQRAANTSKLAAQRAASGAKLASQRAARASAPVVRTTPRVATVRRTPPVFAAHR